MNRTDFPVVPTARHLFLSGDGLDPESRALLEDRFFCALKLKNGTYKQTCRGRLDDLNELVNRLLPARRPLRLMDVAVSSGVTTAEWASSLAGAGVEFEMLAGDSVVDAYHLSVGGRLGALVDPTGHHLQLDIRGRAVSTPLGRRALLRHPLSIPLIKAATFLLFRPLRESASRAGERASFCGVTCRRLDLISSSLKGRGDVRVVQDDLLAGARFERRFHAVRAANILNRAYFGDGQLSAMLVNLRARLLPGGLLVVCRTDAGGVNNATVFSLGGRGRFRVAARLNAGSDIESLALGLAARRPRRARAGANAPSEI